MGNAIRVLLVDDDSAIADLTATYLERASDRIETVVETSPTDALAHVTEGAVDCVVSDYEMPEMDGLTFLDEVRETAPSLPFILFTGKGSEEIASEAISAGVTDYLQKETGTDQYAVLANRVGNAVAQYRAEREAEEADEQIRRIFERITDAFFALDDEWRFRYVNERAADFFDCDPDDVLGEDIRDAFSVGLGDEFRDAYREALETQEPVTIEAESVFRPGTWLEVRIYPAEDGLSVYFRNVTERRQAQLELRDTKQKIEALHDVAARAVACETEQAIYDLAIETAEEILAFDLCTVDAHDDGVLVTKTVSKVVSTDGYYEETPVEAEGNLAARAYREGESSLVGDLRETDVVPAESEYRSALSVPIGDFAVFQAVSKEPNGFDEDDRELAELLAAHISEALTRVRTETELRAERDRFAALFENVPNSVVRYEIDGVDAICKSVNPAFEDVFGWPEDLIIGDEVDDYILPADQHHQGESLNERVKRGDRIEGEEVNRRTRDGCRDFLLHTAPAGNGEAEAFAIYVDITEQKERERQLARQNERLEEFASVVSHDLRNPLNVALGRFDFLAEECESEHLAPIGRSLDRMDSLVEDLLTLARQGQVVDATDPVSLSSVAEAAWETVDTKDAGLRLTEDVVVEADDARFRELLENVFRNAVEHGTTGSPPSDSDSAERTARVEVGPLDDRDGFYVADDGPGVPEDLRDRVFDHGFTTEDEGTGFGLAIVESIADAHGWTVEIADEDRPNSTGTRFEFSRVSVHEDESAQR
ncbi:PAS domain-containing protein [Halorussus sp. MSC15.2]|uniref:PAS domain-containing protein n=1 Tax=Halorussus sp. MSC15.2 TaxID=2283638 RepID=UPI0013D38DEE|nr:PAS domain-containing protein [Halorussus sp. MSC15.2]NEU56487.1 PAS domain-containing protein [Halorussus sp. MSC15.2]